MEAIRDLIEYRLKALSQVETAILPEAHLDEDTISAFVEGRLRENESGPIVSHLIACRFCRRTSAQLIRLESDIEPENERATADEGPGRVQALLESLGAQVPSSEENVVFAYQNPAAGSDQVTPKSTNEEQQTEAQRESEREEKDPD